MSVKVEFKRVQTDAEVENIDVKDGQLIYTGTGKTYMDYGTQRIPTGSGAEPVEVDTEMSDTSENAVQNKVIKEYVDSQTVPEEVIISDTQPTDSDNKLWIDTGEIGSAVSEITNEYSTSTGLGYSANYLNDKIIAESGSNTNGDYIKYTDGTLICTIRKKVNVAINSAWGSLYTGDTNTKYTYPVAFVGNAPVVNYSITGFNSAFIVSWIQSSNNLVETDRYALVRGNTASAQDYVLNITAIGKWK